MEALKIIVFTVFVAILYGIVHDQITAHVCVEYFTIAHPPVFPTQSPFWLAIGWGILATWWVGLALGIGLAASARFGRKARLRLADLRARIGGLMLLTGIGAIIAGFAGRWLFTSGLIPVPSPWSALIPAEKHAAFVFDLAMHEASYAIATLAGVALIVETTWRRVRHPA